MTQLAVKSRLDFAVQAARDVSPFILSHFQSADLEVISKSDATPVTVADRGAEERLRDAIEKAFPGDGVLGEEFDELPSKNGFRWILDPIDGTKSFIHGVPLFGTLIGIERDGELVAGVSRFPALDEVCYAATGEGSWFQARDLAPKRNRVKDVSRLEDAVFCTTTMRRWDKLGKKEVFEYLCRTCKLTRGWGDCYGHCLVGAGRIQLMIDTGMSVWDAAALVPIITEAGGAVRRLAGQRNGGRGQRALRGSGDRGRGAAALGVTRPRPRSAAREEKEVSRKDAKTQRDQKGRPRITGMARMPREAVGSIRGIRVIRGFFERADETSRDTRNLKDSGYLTGFFQDALEAVVRRSCQGRV